MNIRMNITIVTFVTVIAVLASVPCVSAGEYPVACMGTVQFDNETTCPYGWNVYMINLNHSEFTGQPWQGQHHPDAEPFNYMTTGAYDAESDYFKIWIVSPDMKWYGESTARMVDVWSDTMWIMVMNLTVEERPGITKPLPEGWNLISLPMTPTDNSTGAVLSGVTQNAVKLYNATSKQFEDADTMDPGIGYFVHVTNASTWQYCGSAPVNSTSTNLKSGLNMIGVPNCAMDVSTAMGSTDYRYVARWNATGQEYEVYNKVAPSAFHHFTTMEPGEGYFVSAQSDYTLGINCPP